MQMMMLHRFPSDREALIKIPWLLEITTGNTISSISSESITCGPYFHVLRGMSVCILSSYCSLTWFCGKATTILYDCLHDVFWTKLDSLDSTLTCSPTVRPPSVAVSYSIFSLCTLWTDNICRFCNLSITDESDLFLKSANSITFQ